MEIERSHGCEVCGKRFKKGNQLRQHSVIHKPLEEKPFRCSLCDKAFNRAHHLKLHSVKHNKQSPCQCEHCGRGFTQMSNLRRHLLTHQTNRSHACEFCGKLFVQQCSLERHLMKHTNKITFPCKSCGKTFYKLGNLENHSLIHTDKIPYLCTSCGKGFAKESNLKQHSLTHTDQAPHICDVCDRKFTRLGNLKNHLMTHTGYKPHTCDRCGKEFFQVGRYQSHLLTHQQRFKDNKAAGYSLEANDIEELLNLDATDAMEIAKEVGSQVNVVQEDSLMEKVVTLSNEESFKTYPDVNANNNEEMPILISADATEISIEDINLVNVFQGIDIMEYVATLFNEEIGRTYRAIFVKMDDQQNQTVIHPPACTEDFEHMCEPGSGIYFIEV